MNTKIDITEVYSFIYLLCSAPSLFIKHLKPHPYFPHSDFTTDFHPLCPIPIAPYLD